MKKTTRKHLTEADFTGIKQLQDVKLSKNLAAKISGRSHAVVTRVYETNSLKEYKAQSTKAPKVTVKHARPEEDTNLILLKLDQISVCLNTLLDIIQDKEAKANASFWKR